MKISAEDLPAIDFIDNVKSAVSDSVSLSAAITKTNGGDLRIRQNSTGRLGFKNIITFEYQKSKERFLMRSNIPQDILKAHQLSLDRKGGAVLKNETFIPVSKLTDIGSDFIRLLVSLDQSATSSKSTVTLAQTPATSPNNRYVIFDLETTGFHFSSGHRIVEIGMVEVVNNELNAHYHSYVNPERDIPQRVVDVHGVTNDLASSSPKFSEIVDDVLGFINGAPVVAHNAKFDVPFLKSEIEQLENRSWDPSTICTLKVAQANGEIFTGKKTLDALCDYFQVDRSKRIKHGALIDATLTAQVFVKMMGMKLIKD